MNLQQNKKFDSKFTVDPIRPRGIFFTKKQLNKSVKLPFVTKNNNISFCLFKHFMGTSGDDSSPLIEFTPL